MHFQYTDRLSPFVFQISLFHHTVPIRWYGLAYLFGFIMMYVFFRRAAEREDLPLKIEDVDNLAVRIVAGVMIGGRLGFVVQQPGNLLRDPLFLIEIWHGGMAYFGGLAGVILACVTFARRQKIPFLALTDLLALPTCIALGVGRIANFVNGELVGKPTHANWGVIFPSVDMQLRHPSQLYECVSHLLLFVILFYLYHHWRDPARPGNISYCYLIGYGLLRLITDFWRQDDVYWGPLSDGQWFSLGIAVGGAIALYFWLAGRKQPRVRPKRIRKR